MTNHNSSLQRIAIGFGRITLALRGLAWKKAMDAGITPTQSEILQQLAEAPKPLRLGQVAAALAISAPTASDAVSSLVGKGLALKVVGQDKRSLAIGLTPAGAALAHRTLGWAATLERAIDRLSPSEQATLLASLSKIIATLQDEGAISTQRLCLTCQHFRPFAHRDSRPHHCALIDRAFGDQGLQTNCSDHALAETGLRNANFKRFQVQTPI